MNTQVRSFTPVWRALDPGRRHPDHPAQEERGRRRGSSGPARRPNGLVDQAKAEADKIIKDALNQSKAKLDSADSEFEFQTREKRRKLNETERRLVHKEENLDRKLQGVDRRDREVVEQGAPDRPEGEGRRGRRGEGQRPGHSSRSQELERVAGLTQEEAKGQLIRKIEDEAKLEAVQVVKRVEEDTRARSRQLSSEIISQAIQRSAAEHVVESTVSVVDLPSDDMKGRIIGREGRNIRALEMATGVDIIVDDTPEAVILSSFDPDPPRDGPSGHPEARHRRPHPSRPDRGDRRERPGRPRGEDPPGRARRRPTSSASRTSIPS